MARTKSINPISAIRGSFWQLLIFYAILILLVSINKMWKFTFQFEIFALIIAVLGTSLFFLKEGRKSQRRQKEEKYRKTLHWTLFSIALLLIFLFRFIPYIGNSTPLSYDAGIYKYAIEHGLENQDKWILQGGLEPGFLYLMKFLHLFFSADALLKWVFIAFNILLGIAIYFAAKEYFNEKAALIALFLYAFSSVQFQVFSMMYYKNIIGLSLMLFSLYFLKKEKYIPFVVLAGLTGAIHRPTFYIFGLSYLIYTFINPITTIKNKKSYNLKKLKTNIIAGLVILAIFLAFYIGKFWPAISTMVEPVLQSFMQPGESPGTFINFFDYRYSILAFLSLALLGFFYLIKKKQFNMLFLLAAITSIIVYFQFFFFNRFIIHLDIAMIILASIGFCIISEKKIKKFPLGFVIMLLLLFAAFFTTLNTSLDAKPLVDQQDLSLIKSLNSTEQNAFILSTSSYYSPWLQGYSERRVIAPGLFDYNLHNEDEWNEFWVTNSTEEVKSFLDAYEKPLYIFIGKNSFSHINQEKFNNSCFSVFREENNTKIYSYLC